MNITSFVFCLSLLIPELAIAGEIQEQKPIENLGKGAFRVFYKNMKESLDFHIQEYNKKRVDKEQVFKYFYKNERSKLIELVEKHKIKEFPAIKYQVMANISIKYLRRSLDYLYSSRSASSIKFLLMGIVLI